MLRAPAAALLRAALAQAQLQQQQRVVVAIASSSVPHAPAAAADEQPSCSGRGALDAAAGAMRARGWDVTIEVTTSREDTVARAELSNPGAPKIWARPVDAIDPSGAAVIG